MLGLDKIIDLEPFSLEESEKNKIFSKALIDLTKYHYNNCSKYKKIINLLEFSFKKKHSKEDMPFIPVNLFKDYDLMSVKRKEVFKILTSSGTTGTKLSKVFLDKINTFNQKKVLSKIMSSFIGTQRLPLLIIDSKSVFENRNKFSARGAAILGFSIFGFTSIVWEKMCIELKKKNISLDFSKAILLHGGGWKKLEKQNISNARFKEDLKKILKLNKIHNYYGMVEQTGSIFIECDKCGNFITSIFSDILIRDKNFKLAKNGEKGLVQLISILPTSYPGHNIITEDIGEIAKDDSACTCIHYGKRFKIHGRIKNAEIRGCSDI